MADKTRKPVIFLAFANDRDDTVHYLRNLPEEARQIREPLQRARRDGLCELVELANATADDIFRVFQDPEYRDRIAVFHYGGHANGYQLLLELASSSPQTQYGLTAEEGLPEIIAADLLADDASAIAPTLQILLTKMWAKATELNYEHPQFTRQLYQSLKREGLLLRDFLDQQIERFRKKYPEVVKSGLLMDLLALHTTTLGTAGQCSAAQLEPAYSGLGQELSDLLLQCQDLYLLTTANDSTTRRGCGTCRPPHRMNRKDCNSRSKSAPDTTPMRTASAAH